jgi:hypothetical protein
MMQPSTSILGRKEAKAIFAPDDIRTLPALPWAKVSRVGAISDRDLLGKLSVDQAVEITIDLHGQYHEPLMVFDLDTLPLDVSVLGVKFRKVKSVFRDFCTLIITYRVDMDFKPTLRNAPVELLNNIVEWDYHHADRDDGLSWLNASVNYLLGKFILSRKGQWGGR